MTNETSYDFVVFTKNTGAIRSLLIYTKQSKAEKNEIRFNISIAFMYNGVGLQVPTTLAELKLN